MRLNAPQMYGYVCGGVPSVCASVCEYVLCLSCLLSTAAFVDKGWLSASQQQRFKQKTLENRKTCGRLKDEGCQRLWQIPGDSLQYF